MLRFEQIEHRFVPQKPILRGVSASVRSGAITALVGPNGSGKTTLLRIAAGLLAPCAGKVSLEDKVVGEWSSRERARRVAYLAQHPTTAFAFNVSSYVGFGLIALGRSSEPSDVERALDRVGLADRAADPMGVLSGGQRQLAALARVLVQLRFGRTGTFLLADEPTSGMDPAHAHLAADIFAELAAAGCGVLCSIHDLNFARRLASDALLLDSTGQLKAADAVERVLSPEELLEVFGIKFCVLQGGAGATQSVLAVAE